MCKDYVIFYPAVCLDMVHSVLAYCPNFSKLEFLSLYCASVMTTFYCMKVTCPALSVLTATLCTQFCYINQLL